MKSKGFTLIELIIVVAIIGILVALATAHLRKWQTNQPTAPTNGQAAGTLACQGGVLFMIDSNGNAKPATDAQSIQLKC